MRGYGRWAPRLLPPHFPGGSAALARAPWDFLLGGCGGIAALAWSPDGGGPAAPGFRLGGRNDDVGTPSPQPSATGRGECVGYRPGREVTSKPGTWVTLYGIVGVVHEQGGRCVALEGDERGVGEIAVPPVVEGREETVAELSRRFGISRKTAHKMNAMQTRPSEDRLQVFISSLQDPEDAEMSRARSLAIKEVDGFPLTRVWAFEDAPASPEDARDRYIRNASRADMVIWLIGSTTTTPIAEEIDACMRAQGRLLAFKLPATVRDDETETLIQRVSNYATWKKVESVDDLPDHIRASLTEEILRKYRDPAPVNHDLYLRQKHRESIGDTKRLWATLGVPEDIAGELAEDHSVGHKLTIPTTGTLTVNARQGSGKTLAAHRLYQLALLNRLHDHFQALPVFLNARNVSADLKDHIEGYIREHGPVYTQRVLVIMDGLDETGRSKANQLLNQAQSYTDANRNVSAVVTTRPLPGLNPTTEDYTLPECSEEEFLSIASRVAGREVRQSEIPFREYRTRLPLFATIVGAYLRQPMPMWGRTPSQMVSEMVRQALGDSVDDLADAAEFLKTLAVASVNSGESVDKALVARKTSEQARVANSRIVVEEGGRFDFTLAIFREWFAARAIVEGPISFDDIELHSDRWVVLTCPPKTGPWILRILRSRSGGEDARQQVHGGTDHRGLAGGGRGIADV